MIRALFAPFLRYWADLCAWVDTQEGKPRVTFLRSKDGTVPFMRLPSGQILSLKRAAKRRRRAAQELHHGAAQPISAHESNS